MFSKLSMYLLDCSDLLPSFLMPFRIKFLLSIPSIIFFPIGEPFCSLQWLFLVTAWVILTCWASFICTESIDVIMIELWYQTWFVLDFELSSFLMKVFCYAFHFIRYALIRLWICLPFFNIIEFKLWSYEAVRALCNSVHCTAITNENLML